MLVAKFAARKRRSLVSLGVTKSILALFALLTLPGCRGTAPEFGSSPEAARINAGQFWGGLGDRFNNVIRQPKYNGARLKLAHYALAPSKVWDDTSVWTSQGKNERVLSIDAGFDGKRYLVKAAPNVPFPGTPGNARHVMRLSRLPGDEYRWTTAVDFAIGDIKATEFAEVFASLLRATAGRSEAAVRTDFRAAIPRGSAAFGRLFSIDTLRTVPRADGTTDVTFVTRIDPDGVRASFPAFASYLDKYVRTGHYAFTLADKRGARWMEMAAEKYRLTIRLRATADGRMAPLDGTPRPFPNDVSLRGEAFAKVLVFNVGVTDLVIDLKWLHDAHERGWLLRFQRPPEWQLPPLVATMLKSPLKRPFEKGGFTFRLSVRDSDRAQTVISRQIDGTVKESAILRWLSGLSGTVMSDYVGPSEVETNRFLSEGFYGLKSDFAAMFPSRGN